MSSPPLWDVTPRTDPLTISTLLDSERPDDSGDSGSSRGSDEDDEVVEQAPAPPPPVYRPPTRTLPDEPEADDPTFVEEEVVEEPPTLVAPEPEPAEMATAEDPGLNIRALALASGIALVVIVGLIVFGLIRRRLKG